MGVGSNTHAPVVATPYRGDLLAGTSAKNVIQMPRKRPNMKPIHTQCQYTGCNEPTAGLWARYCKPHGDLVRRESRARKLRHPVQYCSECKAVLGPYNVSGLCSRHYLWSLRTTGRSKTRRTPRREVVKPINDEGILIDSDVGPEPCGYPIHPIEEV